MWWWERRERGTEADPASHIVTCDLSHYHLVYHLVVVLTLGHNAWSPTPALLALCNVRSPTPPLRTDLEPRVSVHTPSLLLQPAFDKSSTLAIFNDEIAVMYPSSILVVSPAGCSSNFLA